MLIFQTADEARMEQIQKITYTMNIYEKTCAYKLIKKHNKYGKRGFWQMIVSLKKDQQAIK